MKTRQNHSQKLLCDVCIHLTELNLTFHWTVLKHSFGRIYKWTFGTLWGLRWKRKYLHIRTRQKHTDKFLFRVRIHLTELKVNFHWAVMKHTFCWIWMTTFGALWGLSRKGKYLHIKIRWRHSEKHLCDVCIPLTELNLSFDWPASKCSFSRTWKWTFGAFCGLMRKRKYLHVKSR